MTEIIKPNTDDFVVGPSSFSFSPAGFPSDFRESSSTSSESDDDASITPFAYPSNIGVAPISASDFGLPLATLTPSPSGSLISVPESTSQAALVSVNDSTKVNGLIAGVAVLGSLFLLALGALIFVGLRQRKLQTHVVGSVSPSLDGKKSLDPSISGLESTIASLETQLHEKDIQLREKQASLLSLGRSASAVALSDKSVRERFGKLRTGIKEWVSRYFGGCEFATAPSSDVISILKRSQPNYEALLEDNSTVPLVLRGLVADMICQAFASGQLLGNEAYWELKQAIGAKVSATEANEWRALTSRLLEKTAGYRSDRSEAVEEISRMIDTMCASLTDSRASEARQSTLEQLVDSAATLGLDMAKQRPLFKMEQPSGSVFNSETMEAVSTEDKNQELEGRQVQSVVFPYVAKWGSEKGLGYERRTTIMKALVLL